MVSVPEVYELDEKDKAILRLLQDDAKIPLHKLSKHTELSTTAIRARLKKLIKSEIIKQYVTLIDCRKIGYREMVLASLRVNSSKPLNKLKEEIEHMEMIKYAYVITGEYPLFIMAKCLDHQDSMSLIEKLRNLPGVEEVKTQIVLDRIKEDHSIIIPD